MKKKLFWQILLLFIISSNFLNAFSETPQKNGVLIISAPRTTSTLLMRVLAKNASKVLLEPYTQVFYLSNNLSGAGFNYQKEWPSTPDQAWEMITQSFSLDSFVIKDLAYQMLSYITNEQLKELVKHAHILFLLRSPQATIASGLSAYVKTGNPQDYLSEEVGFIQMKMLFDRFKALGITPWIIEAENYLKDPTVILEKYFLAFNKVFNKETLRIGRLSMEERALNPGYGVWGELWFKTAFDTDIVKPRNLTHAANPDYDLYLAPYQNIINTFLPKHYKAYKYMLEQGLFPMGVTKTLFNAHQQE